MENKIYTCIRWIVSDLGRYVLDKEEMNGNEKSRCINTMLKQGFELLTNNTYSFTGTDGDTIFVTFE